MQFSTNVFSSLLLMYVSGKLQQRGLFCAAASAFITLALVGKVFLCKVWKFYTRLILMRKLIFDRLTPSSSFISSYCKLHFLYSRRWKRPYSFRRQRGLHHHPFKTFDTTVDWHIEHISKRRPEGQSWWPQRGRERLPRRRGHWKSILLLQLLQPQFQCYQLYSCWLKTKYCIAWKVTHIEYVDVFRPQIF